MKNTKVTILASDFKDTRYLNINDCPLARAIKRTLGKSDVMVGGSSISIEDVNFEIEQYDHGKFEVDLAEAIRVDFNGIYPIRTITIK